LGLPPQIGAQGVEKGPIAGREGKFLGAAFQAEDFRFWTFVSLSRTIGDFRLGFIYQSDSGFEFGDQARFADAGFANERDQMALALA
jgi:hypothetical protein